MTDGSVRKPGNYERLMNRAITSTHQINVYDSARGVTGQIWFAFKRRACPCLFHRSGLWRVVETLDSCFPPPPLASALRFLQLLSGRWQLTFSAIWPMCCSHLVAGG
ncbi:hypothetical protein U1Q18_012051 [Sarracenia purpurea var. burkii]